MRTFNPSGRTPMKWTLVAASAIVAGGLSLSGPAGIGPAGIGHAAQPAAPAETPAAALPAASENTITFEQYREWRLRFIERRPTPLTAPLAVADLQPPPRARPRHAQVYSEWCG